MKVEQFAQHLRPNSRELYQKEMTAYNRSVVLESFIHHVAPPKTGELAAYEAACLAGREVIHKFRLVFRYGYLGINGEVIGDEDERAKLYSEIAEYLQLIGAGIDSFVSTHPIAAIEEGGAEDV